MSRARAVMGWLVLLGVACGGCTSSSKSPRMEKNLNAAGWKFIRQDVDDAAAIKFDDSKWQAVTLPHTWNLADGSDGGNNYYRGPAWYRLKLNVPQNDAGKLMFLRFNGATLVSDVWVNGRKIGQHRGGFAAFCYDVTSALRPGGLNVIAVRVDNSKNDDVTPLSGDFTIFGGLYRDVKLLTLDPLHISPMDDASSGLYLKPTNISDASADVMVTAKLRNARGRSRVARVDFVATDRDGKQVAKASTMQPISPGATADAIAKLTIPQPHQWTGRPDPYLYRVTAEVYDDERLTDRVTQPIGLRTFDVDSERGFVLNGKPYPLHGVNRHQEVAGKGWAATPRDVDADYRFITEMGCTTVRLPHYQHDEYEYALCDKLGLVVWAELAQVDVMGKSPAYAENAKQQLRELIKQNYNHPSICFWSLWNEVRAKRSEGIDAKLTRELNDLAHDLDSSRPTVTASERQPKDPVNWISDVAAFNKYFGWYTGTADEWGPRLDEFRAASPGKAMAVSEYGGGASVHHHELNPTTHPKPAGDWHPEEWQAIVHEKAYAAMKDRPWLWGTFLWCMFDFSSDGRHEGDRLGINDKGLVTFDRSTRKDAFYFYKANWTSEPFVHLCETRFNPRPAVASDVKVYSNCDNVELFVDKQSLGKRSGDNGVFVWQDVAFNEGNHHVRAVGRHGGKSVKEEFTWRAAANVTTRPTTQPATTRAAE